MSKNEKDLPELIEEEISKLGKKIQSRMLKGKSYTRQANRMSALMYIQSTIQDNKPFDEDD